METIKYDLNFLLENAAEEKRFRRVTDGGRTDYMIGTACAVSIHVSLQFITDEMPEIEMKRAGADSALLL